MTPASASCNTLMIWASLNRFRFMMSPLGLLYQKTHARSGPFYGGKVRSNQDSFIYVAMVFQICRRDEDLYFVL